MDETGEEDGSTVEEERRKPRNGKDSGTTPVADAGTVTTDAGTVRDAGTVTTDAGTVRDAGTGTPTPTPTPDAGSTVGQLDEDGVIMLAAPNPAGSNWHLGSQNPNTVGSTYFVVYGDPATKVTEGPLTFWTTTGELVTYSDGSPDGRTLRVYMRPGGGTQKYKWNTGALQYGYLASTKDLKNFETTIYVRVRGTLNLHTSMSWLLRGGSHTTDGDLASCTGMQIPFTGQTAKVFREYHHPDYDYVYPGTKFSYYFQEGKWLATKVISWVVGNGTMNRLYIDPDPFDAQGKPRNDFRLYMEWNDVDGQDTGLYTRAATWAGWQTSFRVDGFRNMDFAIFSAREIFPPAK